MPRLASFLVRGSSPLIAAGFLLFPCRCLLDSDVHLYFCSHCLKLKQLFALLGDNFPLEIIEYSSITSRLCWANCAQALISPNLLCLLPSSLIDSVPLPHDSSSLWEPTAICALPGQVSWLGYLPLPKTLWPTLELPSTTILATSRGSTFSSRKGGQQHCLQQLLSCAGRWWWWLLG